MQRAIFLLIVTFSAAALFGCSGVFCLSQVIRLPRDAQPTGKCIAVLNNHTSHQRLLELVEIFEKDGCNVYGYMEAIVKVIILDFTDVALQKAHSIPEIVYIEEEGVSYAANTGSGSGDRDLWYQSRINHISGDGSGVNVYILDTGIMFNHQEFGLRAAYGGYDAVDQYEYVKQTNGYIPMSGKDCHGHGTAVASLVGGKTFGMATKANLYSVRVLRCDTTAPWSVVLDGLNYLAEIIPKSGRNSVVVLALTSTSTVMNTMINHLNNLNVIVIRAAGNSGTNACLPPSENPRNIITVGSADRYDNIASFSNYGPCVDLFAPGEDILAANNDCDSCIGTMSGTTLSAALTAGVVTAYLSEVSQLTPTLMKARILRESAQNIIKFPADAQIETPNLLLNIGTGEQYCGGEESVLLSKEGVLQSPGFPRPYTSNLMCKWTLVAEEYGNHVRLNFSHIVLEKNCDILKICLKNECGEDEKIILTGDYGLPDCLFESEGPSMIIEMSTDTFMQAPGFRATHRAMKGENYQGLKRCTKNSLNAPNSTIQIDVYSAGIYAGNRFAMNKDWGEFFAGRRNGINIAAIDAVNGSVIAEGTFKTHSSSSYSNQLIAFVERIPYGSIVCAAISYDGVSGLSESAKRAIMWLGSIHINYVPAYGSWALIGVKGALPGQAVEVYRDRSSSAEVSARITLKPFYTKPTKITAESAGSKYGYNAVITVNDTIVDIPYMGYGSGLHVVIVDEVTGMIVNKQVFDTSAEIGVEFPSEQFVELIQAQPNGSLVAIAVKEEGMRHLSDEAKQACESIGSALIRQVSYGSWTIVGRKGAAPGSVPEAMAYGRRSKSALVLAVPSQREVHAKCLIQMYNNRYGTGNYISVNGIKFNHPTPGNLVALLRDGECTVERYKSFTASDEFSDFINYIPNDRTVLVNFAINYQGLTENGIAALETIGSARAQSHIYSRPWAVVGKKGAPKGSILEESFYGDAKAFEVTIVVQQTNSSEGYFGSVTLQSAGTDLGNYGKIKVDGQVFTIPPVYDECVVLVLVFDGDTSAISIVETFNMTRLSDTLDPNRFTNLIDSLPNDTVVALTTNDAVGMNEMEDVKAAIEQLGSKYIRQASEGGSWGMIGRKGGQKHSSLEAASKDGPVEIVKHTHTGKNTTCFLAVESSGNGSYGGLQLSINGQSVNTSLFSSKGIRIAIIRHESCELESITTYATHIYYTYTNNLAAMINSLPWGTIVVASIYGSGRESNPNYSHYFQRRNYYNSLTNLYEAFKTIGSVLFNEVSHRDAWAIIGRKGAQPASVLESHVRSISHDQSSALAIGGSIETMEVEYEPCKNKLYPIDCLI